MKKRCYSLTPAGCPVEATLDVIGGKYKGIILYHLLDGKKRFSELRRLMPTATQRMLTLQLRELEECGVITRTVYPVVPPKVEYELTALGLSLRKIVEDMRQWGITYMSRSAAEGGEKAA